MTTLKEMPTRELCQLLDEINGYEIPERLNVHAAHEAARRLSRFAPVKIDPEDEGTWPREGDGDEDGFVWVWLPVSEEWAIRTVGTVRGCGRVASPAYSHWKRIDNEPPQ